MGNQLGTGRGADFMSELPKVETEGEGIVFGRVLGGGRFLKTLQCWHDSSMVVVKAYSKRENSPSLREYGERLEARMLQCARACLCAYVFCKNFIVAGVAIADTHRHAVCSHMSLRTHTTIFT